MARPARLLILAAAAAGVASADPTATEPERGRVSAIVQIGTGYRGIFPFDEEYCGEDDASKSYCLGGRPFALDLGAGIAVMRSLEVIATLSVGLQRDFGAGSGLDGPRPLAFAPGLRLYLADLGRGRFWSTLELPFDFTSYDQADATDIGVRNRNAFEIPLAGSVGALAYFGESASWRRWFRFELEGGVGVVVRP